MATAGKTCLYCKQTLNNYFLWENFLTSLKVIWANCIFLVHLQHKRQGSNDIDYKF